MYVLELFKVTKYYPRLSKNFFDINNIKYYLGGSNSGILALEEVSFKLKKRGVLGILGPNGAGKTTLCKIICGLLKPSSGRALVLGYDSYKEHEKVAHEIFPVFSGDIFLWDIFQYRLSIYDNLKFVGKLWKVPRDRLVSRINSVLRDLGLDAYANEWYQRVSSGCRQLVWIAAALVIEPQILILDEPTIHISTDKKMLIYEVIKNMVKNSSTTVIVATHDPYDIINLCDKIALLYKSLVFYGKIEDFLKFDVRDLAPRYCQFSDYLVRYKELLSSLVLEGGRKEPS